MFRKIILGYYYSPSLGDKLLDFEKQLRKKIKWQIASIFSVFLVLLLMIFVTLLPYKNSINNYIPVEKISSSKDLELSSKIDYASEKREPGSKVVFQLKIKNTSNKPQIVNFKFQTSDITEYGNIISQNGLNLSDKYAYWNDSEIMPGETDIREFSIRLKNKTPTFYQNNNSHDCAIELFFGNITKLDIECPIVKRIEPLLRIGEVLDVKITTLLFCIVAFITSLSLLRSKLLLKQIKSIKLQGGANLR